VVQAVAVAEMVTRQLLVGQQVHLDKATQAVMVVQETFILVAVAVVVRQQQAA
jgi:hypothetical protein